MCTNEIISYDLSLSPNMIQISNMLSRAFEEFPELDGLIMHSDKGWQYHHEYFRKKLKEHNTLQSMS